MTSKPCRKCGEVKPLGDFYAQPQMSDGHLNYCKPCVKERTAERSRRLLRESAEYREHRRAHNRAYARAQGQERTRSQRAKHPEKSKARGLLNDAVRTGKIVKPAGCERCGAGERIQGHHPDYSRPLDVMWLCSLCHGDEHRKTA